ncbi:unnamed protein product [Meloidogyne enterolobii]|uniref:Uncharacterized protein n=1 Tax=Meloidogyne enterolobii TaxID=390850 RepID=A0ACB0ZFC7_MELEN
MINTIFDSIESLAIKKPEHIDPELFIKYAIYYYEGITDLIINNLNLNPDIEEIFINDINEFEDKWNKSKIIKVEGARDFIEKLDGKSMILKQLDIKIPKWITLVNELMKMEISKNMEEYEKIKKRIYLNYFEWVFGCSQTLRATFGAYKEREMLKLKVRLVYLLGEENLIKLEEAQPKALRIGYYF